jgi:hypothetical protein
MIDVNLQLPAIEKLMELMARFEIDELSVDFVNIKKSRHRLSVTAGEPDPKLVLEKHISPDVDDQPWLALSQQDADKWAAGQGT